MNDIMNGIVVKDYIIIMNIIVNDIVNNNVMNDNVNNFLNKIVIDILNDITTSDAILQDKCLHMSCFFPHDRTAFP